MIVYENTAYSLITAYFFDSLIRGKGDDLLVWLGLTSSLALMILTHYNAHLKRNRYKRGKQ